MSQEEYRKIQYVKQMGGHRSVLLKRAGRPQNTTLAEISSRNFIRPGNFDEDECVFVCSLIDYEPAYYVLGTQYYFPVEEIQKFVTYMSQWCLKYDPAKIERWVSRSEMGLSEQHLDKIRLEFSRVVWMKNHLSGYIRQGSSRQRTTFDAKNALEFSIMTLCNMVEKLMDKPVGKPPLCQICD